MKREFFAVIKFFAGAYCVLSLAFFIAFMSIGTADLQGSCNLFFCAILLVSGVIGYKKQNTIFGEGNTIIEKSVGVSIPAAITLAVFASACFLLGAFIKPAVADEFSHMMYYLWGTTAVFFAVGLGMRAYLLIKEKRYFLAMTFASTCAVFAWLVQGLGDLGGRSLTTGMIGILISFVVSVIVTALGFILKKDMDPNFKFKSEALPTMVQ